MMNNIICYIIFTYAFHWFAIFYCNRAHFTKNADPVLRKKFAPFVRNDMQTWHTIWNIFIIPTAIPRVLLGFILLATYGITTMIVMIGVDPHKIDKTRHCFIKYMGWFICRSILLTGGVIWIKTER